ncbi:MAG: CoA pyrophosphatase [Anaerovoracaceae bacterium]
MVVIDDIKKIYSNRKVETVGKHRYFSVLLPIVEDEGILKILFEIRSLTLDTQPGEVCLPGGEIEKFESPCEAALRETREEIGVTDIEILGQGDDLIPGFGFTMHTFIGKFGENYKQELKLSKDEVHDVFLVPIDWFMNNEPDTHILDIVQLAKEDFPYDKIKFENGYNFRRGKAEVPIYVYEDKVIWGLTARIINKFVKVLSTMKK